MSIGSLVGVGTSLLGGFLGANATKQASQQQTQAAQQALAAQQQMFGQAQSALSPYYNAGSSAIPGLQNAATTASGLAGTYNPQIAGLNQPDFNSLASQYLINSNWGQSDLENTPGYQFTRDQGLKAVQNSAAARGLGLSGNAIKAAEDYASGLASTTYQQQYQNYANAQQNNFANAFQGGQQQYSNALGNIQNQFSNALQGNSSAAQILQGIYGTGAGAASSLGNAAVNSGNQQAQTYGAIGNAQALGTLGANNAWQNALGSIGGYGMFAGLQGNGSNPAFGGYNTTGGTTGGNFFAQSIPQLLGFR